MENKNINLTGMPIFEGSFNTEIGILNYLWFKEAGEPVICFLGIEICNIYIERSKGIGSDQGIESNADVEQSTGIKSSKKKRKSKSEYFLEKYIEKPKNISDFNKNPVIKEKKCKKIENEIHKYLEGISGEIKLNYKFLTGTSFEKKVWIETSKIPYGKTLSYKEIADLAGNPRACRAVGNALSKNPLMIIIPCHRVIKTDGSPGGFGGSSAKNLRVKRFLLDLERTSEQNFT